MTIFDFSFKITTLKNEKKYAEALQYFKENKGGFVENDISQNAYIVSNIISCLRYTKNYDAGFKFIDRYGIQMNNETQERVLNAYGWLLWEKYKLTNSNNDVSLDDSCFLGDDDRNSSDSIHYEKNKLLHQIGFLLKILFEQKSVFANTLISNLFMIVLKSEKAKIKPNWRLVSDFLDQINPEYLSKECQKIEVARKGKQQEMELASDYEYWYAYKTKALSKLSKWQECCDFSKEALHKLDRFHYSNDVWFTRRIALSKINLGDMEAAIYDLEAILNKKKEWFIQKELAELYFEKGSLDHAFELVMASLNNFGPLEFKVDLLFLTGRILLSKDERELAFKHFILSRLVREQNEWKVPQKLVDELNKLTAYTVALVEAEPLEKELKKYWKSHEVCSAGIFQKKSQVLKGEVVKILNDNERGKDGFVKCNGDDYYFSLPINNNLFSGVSIGTKVEVKIIISADNKKHKAIIKSVDV